MLPRLTPATDLGAKAVAAYAARQGVAVDAFVAAAGPVLTPEQAGIAVRGIVERRDSGAFLLTSAGLSPVA